MAVSYLVDSGASRDGLPSGFFPQGGERRETGLRSSNGMVRTWIQKLFMPRLRRPTATTNEDLATEAREVLHIKGPPVISMGRTITASPTPMLFCYAQGWQGFVHGQKALNIL